MVMMMVMWKVVVMMIVNSDNVDDDNECNVYFLNLFSFLFSSQFKLINLKRLTKKLRKQFMKNVVRLRRWLICRCLIKHRPGECRLVKLCWLILLTCNMSYTQQEFIVRIWFFLDFQTNNQVAMLGKVPQKKHW